MSTDAIKEVFGSPDFKKIAPKELALYKNLEWTMWEYIEYEQQKQKTISHDDYHKLLRKVAWFDNMVQFHQVWNKIPHA